MWKFFIFYVVIAINIKLCVAEKNGSADNATPTTTPYMTDEVTLRPGSTLQLYCNGTHPAYCLTKNSLDTENRTIARGLPQSYAAFKCPLLNNINVTNGITKWYLFNTSTLIGFYDYSNNYSETTWTRNGSYKILEDGGLLILEGRREYVDRYICTYEDNNGSLITSSAINTSVVLYRLNFSSWYSHVVFDSVFYGSVVVSVLLCSITFIINLIWIAIQKGGLYWIKRRERENRVQSMIEAVEVYRQRQIQNLQDAYHRNVSMVRDQYHMQVEQIRDAYTNQISRLKDYRQARMDNVTSHLDNIRDNYNQQLSRMREYGSRHGEQLFESYERQLNRVRTFSLQQRLKLMRQYKLKQRHVNKLLANVDDSNLNVEANSENLRKVFDFSNEILPAESIPLRRSVSCLSLPEFTLVDGNEFPELKEIPGRRLTNNMDLRQWRRPQKKTVSECENMEPVAGPSRVPLRSANDAMKQQLFEEQPLLNQKTTD
uniref:Ig-like domain-containing protein n=1 Tax=Panagrolaimus sp. ES5 TaxID=591445 RepID=A0AC34FGF1_9BILA